MLHLLMSLFVFLCMVIKFLLHYSTIFIPLFNPCRYGVTIVGDEVSAECSSRGVNENDVASMSSLLFRDVSQPADSSSATTYNICFILTVYILYTV